MTNLQDICDLPLEYDDLCHHFQVSSSDCFVNKREVHLESLIPSLLNTSVTYPEDVYEEYRVCLQEDESVFNDSLKYDVMVLPSGLLGIEFIKSHLFYTPCSGGTEKFSTIVEGIYGTVTVMMQKNLLDCDIFDPSPSVKEGIIVELGPKEKLAIPEGYMYTFINSTMETCIISRVYKKYAKVNYKSFGKTRGMAYFCIRKNAKQEFVFNPRYRETPSIKKSTPEENHVPKLGLNTGDSLYVLAKTKTEMFMEILSD